MLSTRVQLPPELLKQEKAQRLEFRASVFEVDLEFLFRGLGFRVGFRV